MISRDEIVDDLKVAIAMRYPHSLASRYDPSDISLTFNNRVEKESAGRRFTHGGPGTRKVSLGQDESQSSRQAFPDALNLEADLNLWELLDDLFRNGMKMSDALLINTPNCGAPDQVSNKTSFSRLVQKKDISLTDELKSPTLDGSHLERMSPLSNVTHKFHHPKPQHPGVPHDRLDSNSLSHSIDGLTNRNLQHKRATTLSPQLSGDYSGLTHSKFYNTTTTNNTNTTVANNTNSNHNANTNSGKISGKSMNAHSHAILLLPKKFNLAEQQSQKRFSADESSPASKGKMAIDGTISPQKVVNVSNVGKDVAGKPKIDSVENQELVGKNLKAADNLFSTVKNSDSRTVSKTAPLKLEPKGGARKSGSSDMSKSIGVLDGSGANTFDRVLPLISVLVVEDNSINQAILGAFLRKHKIHYEIAKNGQEAIDKWRKGGFHLVLMDIQLPVKSGIEATQEIRYLEKVNKIGVFAQHELAQSVGDPQNNIAEVEKLDLSAFRSPVIIVALTASSNSSIDKKNALTAGCNDFLTKPVNLVWLQNKITEWGCMQALINFDGWRANSIKDFSDSASDGNTPKTR